MTNPPALCLFGASPSTGNLGVSALMHSAVAAVHRHDPEARVLIFDHGRGASWRTDHVGGAPVVNPTHGAHLSRRYWRSDNLRVMQGAAMLRLPWNRAVAGIRGARAVLDVSGGDSFSDIYGTKRFQQVTLPKRLALSVGTPLVLLPQTYGPFRSSGSRRTARELVLRSRQAWARDPDSYQSLLDLVGEHADPSVHRQGVDMAFALEVHEAPAAALDTVTRWREAGRTVVGLNVSGLTYTEPAGGRFGFRLDYRGVIQSLLAELMSDDSAAVLLIPHVDTDMPESDRAACEDLEAVVGARHPGRLAVSPPGLDQCQVKGLISTLDWFAGTRMHSTIAGLSTQTPTATLAYSMKARGVFATCGVDDQVADARLHDTDEALEILTRSYAERDTLRARLAETVPAVRGRAADQMTEILSSVMPEDPG